MNILVTGGAGFIGCNYVKYLMKKEEVESIVVIDNYSTGDESRIRPLCHNLSKVQVVCSDINNIDKSFLSRHKITHVNHFAAIPRVKKSVDDPINTNFANINGTLKLLQACREYGEVKRIVFSSSSSVYGGADVLPTSEMEPTNPKSPYALQKLAGEYYMKYASDFWGYDTVSLRYFNVFGVGQDPDSQYGCAIPNFITAALKGERPTIYGDGEQTRDFTYVENVCEGNWLALSRPRLLNGERINIACGERTSLNQIIKMIEELLNKKIDPIYEDVRPGDVRHTQCDYSKAEKMLGFKPLIYFKEGLEKSLEYYKNMVK